ncbi:glycoside hydrolase family 2 TIM barrel-domain containing protein [Faecalicatena orotica]|uniref:Beta-galactosidase n=1 Tax=Faecalicatena orotica TaxID=1544 RepID=A0A2Y9BLL6_9FIRM|nr:glycoside hydrolase family 2 TIM barrel-domain containing protein [Faecalicatena orotica]PWJ21520.1 beta-galactosidase [Faecalicatena orotica]SSA58330.1 beta-galactosidase [Faecalicatena orotica]
MLEQLYNDSWKYWIDKDAFALTWNIPEIANDITLPHDAMIEKGAYAESPNGGNTGFRDGDVYNYVKLFTPPVEYRDKTVKLKFEGVYMNAMVYVNGELAAKSPFGYTTFYACLDEFLRYGEENEIRVQVRNGAMTNSRWYSGGGIYRDVYILIADLVHIKEDGVQITTENVANDYASILVSTELENLGHASEDYTLETIIQNSDGQVVASDRYEMTLFGQEERKTSQRIAIMTPQLWSEETPVLYTCSSKLYQGDTLIDENLTSFGIRILKLSANRGFCVNGKEVKLRGACIHHDSGLLGAATYEEVQYRQVKKLKEAGFNALRMSHHPMAPAMLRACDELGMYVMDETFDMWNRCKSDYDYGLYFNEWWETDVTAMVRKDYNHPCVILYSIGNEIPEIGTNHGARVAYQISRKIKSLDNTRYTLAAINGVYAAGDSINEIVAEVAAQAGIKGQAEGNVNVFMSVMDKYMDKIVMHEAITERLEKACAETDIAGYNYMTARYEKDGENYPNRVIVGSETYPPEIAKNWEIVKKCSHVIGDFTWTGWDYIGEAGVGIPAYNWGDGGFGAGFPCQLAYCGDIDITGYRRPASYYREIVFGLRKAPYITVQNPQKYSENLIKTPWVLSDSIASWTFKDCDGKPVIVEIYSAGDEVELLCNGKSLGKKTAGRDAEYRVYFETVYEAGTLTAISYENGIEIGKDELKTAGSNRKLVLYAEQPAKIGAEFIFVNIELQDENGIIVTDEDMEVHIVVKGAALAGFGSGNPKPQNNFTETTAELFHGRALAIIKKTESINKADVFVKTKELNAGIQV